MSTAQKNKQANQAPKKAPEAPIQDAEVIKSEDGTEKAVVVAEESAEEQEVGFFGKVGNVVKKVWKPVVIGAGLVVAGIATGLVLSDKETSEEDDEDDEDDEDYSILDEI